MEPSHCPVCGSEDIYFSKKKQIFVCEDCDHRFIAANQDVSDTSSETTIHPLHLFFSYGHDSNEELVFQLKQDLESRGHTVWIDKQEIKAGHDWRQSILEGISNSESVLAFLSRHSVRDPGVCRDELQIALNKDAVINTVLLENEQEVSVPASVANVQWLDMQDWKNRKGESAWKEWYKQKFSELCRVVESEENLTFAGELEEIRRIFNPSLNDTKERRLNEQAFVGRVWIHEEMDRWRKNDPNSKLLAILGGPGTGKSRYVAHALHYNPYILCSVFCEWDKQEFNNARNIVIQLIFKLACKLRDYRKKLLELIRQKEISGNNIQLEQLSALSIMDEYLIHPLSSTIDGGREVQFVVIDGLDEADEEGENVLIDLITRCMDNLPRWIKFVVTSRPEKNILYILENFNPAKVYIESNENNRDMESYIREELQHELAENGNEQMLIKEIIQRSEGAFLYVRYFIQAVKDGTVSLNDPRQYPSGLGGFYLKNFKRKFPKLSDYKQVRDYFELLAAAQNLPVTVLLSVLHQDNYDLMQFESLTGSLIKRGIQYLPESKQKTEVLNFHHKSLADWLTKTDSGIYFVDRKSGGQKLATYAYKQIRSEKAMSESSEKDMLNYLKLNLTEFYLIGNLWQELKNFLLEKTTPLEPYWLALESVPGDTVLEELMDHLTEELTKLFREVESKDFIEYFAAFLHYFEQLNQEHILMLLFDQIYEKNLHNYILNVPTDKEIGAGELFNQNKLKIAYSVSIILNNCRKNGIRVSETVKLKLEFIKLSSLFVEGKLCNMDVRDVRLKDLLSLYEKYGHILNHNHCALPVMLPGLSIDLKGGLVETDWMHLGDLFNTLCFIHEINNGIDFMNINTLRMLGVDIQRAIALAPQFVNIENKVVEKEAITLTQISIIDPFVIENIARMYGSIGEYAEALDWFEHLRKLQEKTLGLEHLDTASVYEQIAYYHNECGTYNEGMKWYQKALDIRLKKLGDEDPGVASIYHNIGKLVGDMGREDLAIDWLYKALAIREKMLGKEHVETGLTYSNLGYSYEFIGKLEEANEANAKALKAFQTSLRPDHPHNAMVLVHFASVYEKLGNFEESLKTYKKALMIREKALGKEHPHTARTYTSLGLVYRQLGDLKAALKYLDKAKKVRERVFGVDHPETAVVYHRIAKVYHDLNRHDEAMELLQKALKIRVNHLEKVNPETAQTWHDIGLIYNDSGEIEQAQSCFKKALLMREALFTEDHPAVSESRNMLTNSD